MKASGDVKRVLIYRLGSLGDTVIALPCLHLIDRAFPYSRRVMLTNFPVHAKAPAASAVLGDSGLVHGYLRYAAGTRNPLELVKLAWKIRRFSPDVMVYLMPVRPSASLRRDLTFFRTAAGIRHFVGVPSQDVRDVRFHEDTGLYELEALRLARCLEALGPVDLDDPASWDLRLSDEERARGAEALTPVRGMPLICFAIGSKKQPNDWGTENWVALAAKLWQHFPGHALILAGAPEDREASDLVAGAWNGASLNLSGRLSPRETAAVMSSAELFVGPDSGPGHLASAVGTPCVSVFSARDHPGKWFPHGAANQIIFHRTECTNCQLDVCVEQQKKCILSITVDEVASAAIRAWDHGRMQAGWRTRAARQ